MANETIDTTTAADPRLEEGVWTTGPDGTLVNRDYERAWLPRALGPGDRTDVRMKITAPSEPGRYTLKFDLVSEGIDWF